MLAAQTTKGRNTTRAPFLRRTILKHTPWQIRSMEDYLSAYKKAKDDPEGFWSNVAESFSWKEKWNHVAASDLRSGEIAWFTGAKVNITENCLDRHVVSQPDKTALIFEPNEPSEGSRTWTYRSLASEVNKVANMLAKLGVRKGDRVVIYMPMLPELLFSVLACARLGAVHSVVFGGFSAESLTTRIKDTGSCFVITADAAIRGEKSIPLKATLDEALASLSDSPVRSVVVLNRLNTSPEFVNGRDVWWHDAIKDCSESFAAVPCDSEDPLFILYTSGSTGSPKGILHTQGGYMIWAAYTFANVFQVDENSIHWCTADLGWITGHSYIAYGPLLTGTTTVMFEGIPTWPTASRLWQIVEKHAVTHFYTAPTLIRSLQTFSDEFVTKSDRSSLQVLGTVGEPINASAWTWYFDLVGEKRCPVVDTWWQTETGGILISALAGISPLRKTYAGLPLPGVVPVLVTDDGHEIGESDGSGNLCITQSWPGMMRTVYGNHERFLNGYLKPFPGRYFTGDGAVRDVDGMYRITGRVDDVLNVSGHRLGTAEIENAINKHPSIVESAVIGASDEITGQAVVAFVVLDPGAPPFANLAELFTQVQAEVTRHIGALAKPKRIYTVTGLPKTRSGKIMRRILRAISEGKTSGFGDTSTLINPEIIDGLVAAMQTTSP
jgi:acetyl-CoA synthetase